MKVVLKHAGRWLHFQCPEKVLVAERIEDVLPMLQEAEASGLFAAGFISYEAAPAFDRALSTMAPDGFPLLCLGLFPPPDVLDEIEEPPSAGFGIGELKPTVSKEAFTEAIGQIKDRIAEGATYQVNYTYRLQADFSGDAWAFFYELVKGQKTEHAAFIETDDYTICSASPELFFSFNQGRIVSRPMKGTAKRGMTLSEDWKQAEALRESVKDRAENIMIVDMIRNDIGRVATPGSVETVSMFDVEKYPTVWQMTSTVTGEFETEERKGREEESSLGDLCGLGVNKISTIMSALFPCSSITGAPKAKTMEIIQGLETSPRKIYTGSIGFITPQGESCFNVAIRTALIDKKNGQLEYGVGGGVVWDSDAESEYEETLMKARVLDVPRPEFQLLETMRWEPESGIFLMDEHMQRLAKSAAYFDVPLEMHAIFQGLENAFQTLEKRPHRIRLLVAGDGNSEIQTFPLEDQMGEGTIPAVHVAVAKEAVDSQNVFLYHKTTHRTVYEGARAEFPEQDDVILWNEKGELTESCMANVVLRKDGRLITPPIRCGLLAGTFREHLLKSGEIEEGMLTREDLQAATEVFLVNSVRKWQKACIK
ncbi:chorismate-binding protein [Pontiellaceae bacterium B12227]|nr:chorismate-binding protein [Pontiellaceae bacterium B12227]